MQAGLLYRNGQSALPQEIVPIFGDSNGTCGISHYLLKGSLAIGFNGGPFTYEKETRVQPFVHGSHILTFDGRLHNREDLARRAHLTNSRQTSDLFLVAALYEKFGESIISALVGEFAMVLWSESNRRLVFARSTCGTHPLYYVLTKDRLVWSSDFAQLVRVLRPDTAVNDDYVLEYLAMHGTSSHSPLQSVSVIPSNSLVIFEQNEFRSPIHLWNPANLSPLRYHSDNEYSEHCREQLKEAVRVRMPAEGVVATELSGGLDSSSVVMLADEILREQNRHKADLFTISCIFETSTLAMKVISSRR